MAEFANGGPPPISDGTPSPQSLPEFETLIKRFYEPGNVSLVSSIEKHLQWHQRSTQGWDMAVALLQSDDVKVRFFGALTLAVKLNVSGRDLDEEETMSLEQRLVSLYVERRSDVMMVTQKMSSVLNMFYMLPHASAGGCIARLGAAFMSQSTDSASNANRASAQPLAEILPRLDMISLHIVLQFVNGLAEEGSKRLADAGSDRKQAAKYQERVEINVAEAVEVMRFCLEPLTGQEKRPRTQAVSCFASWATFCQRAVGVELEQLTLLRTLLRPTLVLAAEDEDDAGMHAQSPMDTIADLLLSYPAFFKIQNLRDISELLRSPKGQQYFADLKNGDGDAMPFARLLCAYVDADLAYIVEAFDDPAVGQIMEMMHGLLHCDGYAAVEDTMIVEMSGIWNTFVEYIVDTAYDAGTQPTPPWHASAKAQIVRMVEEMWTKIQYPPEDVFRSWPTDDKKAFQQFRADFRDLLNTCHLALSTQLLQAFVRMSLGALVQQEWTQLEAALFCLQGIAESFDESEEEDEMIAQLMNSHLYPTLSNADHSIPLHVRRTAMRLIGNLGSYFERHTDGLSNVLQYLFTSLAAPSLADAASRSIYELCTACRESLKPQLEEFFSSYERFLGWPTASAFTKSRVIGAVAAIAQTCHTDGLKARALTRLLDYVDADVRSALEYMANGDSAQSAVAGASAVTSLSLIAKSFGETLEVINLEESPSSQNYWTGTTDGQAVQERIVRVITSMLEILGPDMEILDAVCDCLKAGFAETSPGPFVLQPSVVTSIITRPQANSQHVCLVLGAACSFVRAYTPTTTPSIEPEVQTLLTHLVDLTRQLGDPRNDPEVAQAIVEVLSRYMPRYTTALIHTAPEPTFSFTMSCIAAPEPLPKRAAAHFWSTFLALTSQPQPLQGLLDQVAEHFGPALARVLVTEVAHNSMRSDIDTLADPLKRLWARHPRARSWFEAALGAGAQDAAAAPPVQGVSEVGMQLVAAAGAPVKYKFLEQLRAARDLGSVRKAMQEFGAGCKAAWRGR